MSASLIARREQFCQEYLIDLNGAQAAVRAGYSAKTAASQAERLLRNVEVQARIRELQALRCERVEVQQDEVLSTLIGLLRADLSHFEVREGKLVPAEGAPKRSMKLVTGFKRRTKRYLEGEGENAEPVEVEEVEIRLASPERIVELAGKHLGLWLDRLKIEDPEALLARVLGVTKGDLPK